MDKTITEYFICKEDSTRFLMEQVRDMIKDGWQPFGALNKYRIKFYQTMVKYETVEDEPCASCEENYDKETLQLATAHE